MRKTWRLNLPNGWSLRWTDPQHMTCALCDPEDRLIGNLYLADAKRFAEAMKAAPAGRTALVSEKEQPRG